jgi:hypothetical protein
MNPNFTLLVAVELEEGNNTTLSSNQVFVKKQLKSLLCRGRSLPFLGWD